MELLVKIKTVLPVSILMVLHVNPAPVEHINQATTKIAVRRVQVYVVLATVQRENVTVAIHLIQ